MAHLRPHLPKAWKTTELREAAHGQAVRIAGQVISTLAVRIKHLPHTTKAAAPSLDFH